MYNKGDMRSDHEDMVWEFNGAEWHILMNDNGDRTYNFLIGRFEQGIPMKVTSFYAKRLVPNVSLENQDVNEKESRFQELTNVRLAKLEGQIESLTEALESAYEIISALSE